MLKSFVSRQLPEDPVLLQLLFMSCHQLLRHGLGAALCGHPSSGTALPGAGWGGQGWFCQHGLLQAMKRRLLPEAGDAAGDAPDAGRLPDTSRLLTLFDGRFGRSRGVTWPPGNPILTG